MSVQQSAPSPSTLPLRREIALHTDGLTLHGDLHAPTDARGIVLFAHGSGSSRLSPRNRYVAEVLNHSRMATLLMDLLDTREEEDRDKVFDIDLLTKRFALAAQWVAEHAPVAGLPVGYFGASTGAAVALTLAAQADARVKAVVSRGGRPDLAGAALPRVKAPVLLIVGGDDPVVLELNRAAAQRLHAPNRLVVVPGATHLFAEAGKLEEVARLAAEWFSTHLTAT